MLKTITLILVISFTSIQTYSQYSSPESVTYDSIGQRYLISNTSSQNIVQRSRNGIVTDFVTVGGGPVHGITVYNNKVFVCNGSRIKGYDLTSAAEVFNVPISGGPTFLNDLAIDNAGILYISDFSLRKIYKLNTTNSQYWTYVENTVNIPNGVYVDAPRNRLLICCWGASAPVRAANFADSSITTLVTTSFSNCDGISLDRNDNVYISTWGIQSVVRYDINFINPPVTVVSSLSNPADIYVNKETDTLAVPNAGNNTVTFHFLNNPLSVNEITGPLPNSFELYQNFPNPFNPNTTIKYTIGAGELRITNYIVLKVYDILGNEVATLVNEKQSATGGAGSYSVEFDGTNFPSGIYFYKIKAGNFRSVKTMVLIK